MWLKADDRDRIRRFECFCLELHAVCRAMISHSSDMCGSPKRSGIFRYPVKEFEEDLEWTENGTND